MKVLYSPKFPRVLRKPGVKNLISKVSHELEMHVNSVYSRTVFPLPVQVAVIFLSDIVALMNTRKKYAAGIP